MLALSMLPQETPHPPMKTPVIAQAAIRQLSGGSSLLQHEAPKLRSSKHITSKHKVEKHNEVAIELSEQGKLE
jgi:hypothetical protein